MIKTDVNNTRYFPGYKMHQDYIGQI